jgi:uncharacterized membrane protein
MNTHAQTGYTHVMYALHAFAGLLGVTSGATIIGAFVFGIPSILAIFMNYARRDAVRGSWLESHFEWQSRTFWTAAVLLVSLVVIAFLLVLFGVVSLLTTPLTGPAGVAGGAAGLGGAWLAFTVGAVVTGLWILYRVIRGWMALRDGKAI